MAKLTLADVANLMGNPTSAANTVNANSALVETAFENTLSRNGTTPNQMESDFDMNHNDVLNVNQLSASTLILDGVEVVPTELASGLFDSAARPTLTPANDLDDTEEIQSLLDTYGTFYAKAGYTYYIRSQITMPANSSIICLDPNNRAEFRVDMDVFTNATLAGELGTTAVIFNAVGGTSSPYTPLDNIAFENIRIVPIGYLGTQGSVVPARRTSVINARNVNGLRVIGCEIDGFCVGTAISIDSCVNDTIVRNNYIHNWYSNDEWSSNPTSQTTAIRIDENRINNDGTTDFSITGNQIENLVKGAVPIADYGPQTDGININGGSGGYGVVAGNIISNVDEGVDCFGQGVTIMGNVIRSTSGAGIKIIHGASKNQIIGNFILNASGWGISCTSSVAGAVQYNQFKDNYVEATGGTPNPFLTTTACLNIGESVTACQRNTFSGNTWFANGAMYLCKNNDTLGNTNFSTGDEWIGPGTSGWFNTSNLLLICERPVDGTRIKSGLVSNLTRNSAGDADIVWDDEIRDTRGEFSTSTGKFTAQLPGYYDVIARIHTSGMLAAGNRAILKLRDLDGTALALGTAQTTATIAAQPQLAEFSVLLGSGEGLYTTLEIESNPGGTITFNADDTQTAFEIRAS